MRPSFCPSFHPSFLPSTLQQPSLWTDGQEKTGRILLCSFFVSADCSPRFLFFTRATAVSRKQRDWETVFLLSFFLLVNFTFSAPTPPTPPLTPPSLPPPVDRRWGVRDRGRQRQYFTAAAQSSSAGTQYLQPTAMQQWQICLSLSVCVCERVTEWEREGGI